MVERDERYRVRLLALQPLSAGKSAEFSEADNSKTIQPREINLTSLDSLGSCESIYVYINPKKQKKHEYNHFKTTGTQSSIYFGHS